MKKLIFGAIFAASMGISFNASAQFSKMRMERAGPANGQYDYVVVNRQPGGEIKINCYESGNRGCNWNIDLPASTPIPTLFSAEGPVPVTVVVNWATAKIQAGFLQGEGFMTSDIFVKWEQDGIDFQVEAYPTPYEN